MDKEIIYIILGWLFGILSPGIVDLIKNVYQRKAIKKAIIIEMKDLKMRLFTMSYLVKLKIGGFTKPFIQMLQKGTEEYTGNENISLLKELLNQSEFKDENKIANSIEFLNQRSKKGAISLKNYNVSSFYSYLPNLHLFDSSFQTKILELKRSVDNLNEEILCAKEYSLKTFDSSLSDENHKIITAEIFDKYESIDILCIQTVNKIDRLLQSGI